MGLKQQTNKQTSETNKQNNKFKTTYCGDTLHNTNILWTGMYSLLAGLQLRDFHVGLPYTPGMVLDSLDCSLLFPPKYFSLIEEILPKFSGSTP